MGFLRTLQFIAAHPLGRRHVLKSVATYLRWQMASRLLPGAFVHNFVDDATLVVTRGLTGATGNIYVGLHEFEEMAFALHALRSTDLFVDVGANVGSYTILASKVVGARTIAFEPVPGTWKWVELNVAINQITGRVDLRSEALGARKGMTAFTTEFGSSNRVANEQLDWPGSSAFATLRVPITTLDEALAGLGPALIKIDVEGFETAVIAGAQATLARPELKCIIMELNGAGAAYGFDEAALRNHMRSLGFNEYSYRPFERLLTPYEGKADNVILVRDLHWIEKRVKEAARFRVLGECI
jgi:FkbM family methyltransferase